MIGATLACRDAAVIGQGADVLATINDPDVHLALWERPRPASLSGLSTLDWNTIDDFDAPVSVDELDKEMPRLVADAGYGDLAPALARELTDLADRFAAIMSCAMLRVRLEVIETDACRRFHADLVTVRLLMPLVGPGTQWRHAETEDPVQQLQVGEVGLFKGRRLTEKPRILHRSPPVMHTGETRLLLAVDPWIGDDAA